MLPIANCAGLEEGKMSGVVLYMPDENKRIYTTPVKVGAIPKSVSEPQCHLERDRER